MSLDKLSGSQFSTAKDVTVLVFHPLIPTGVMLCTQAGENNWVDTEVRGEAKSVSNTIDGFRVVTIHPVTYDTKVTIKRTSPMYQAFLRIFAQEQQFPYTASMKGSIWIASPSLQMAIHLVYTIFISPDGIGIGVDKEAKESTLHFNSENFLTASFGAFTAIANTAQAILNAETEDFNIRVQRRMDNLNVSHKEKQAILQEAQVRYNKNMADTGSKLSNLAQKTHDNVVKNGGKANDSKSLLQEMSKEGSGDKSIDSAIQEVLNK